MKTTNNVKVKGTIGFCSENRNEFILIKDLECIALEADHAWIPKQCNTKLINAKQGDIITFIANTSPYTTTDGTVKLGFKNIRHLMLRTPVANMIVKKKSNFVWVNRSKDHFNRSESKSRVSITITRSQSQAQHNRLTFNFSVGFSEKFNLNKGDRFIFGFDKENKQIAMMKDKNGFKISANNSNKDGGVTSYKMCLSGKHNVMNIGKVTVHEDNCSQDGDVVILDLKGLDYE